MGFEAVAEFLEASEPANEGFQGVLGVGRAGVGDDEDLRRADGVRLEAELWLEFYSLGVPEVVAIDHQALEADDGGLKLEQFLFEDGGVGAVVFST